MQKRKFTSDVEKEALKHLGSRTVIFYMLLAYTALFSCSIIFERALALSIVLGLILLVMLTLSYFSLKGNSKKPFLSLSLKTHLLSVFFTSFFSAPAIAIFGLNKTDEFISGTPFSLISVIALGYVALCLILGVPAVLIIDSVKSKRIKQKKLEDAILSAKGLLVEPYSIEMHGSALNSSENSGAVFEEGQSFVTTAKIYSFSRVVRTVNKSINFETVAGYRFEYVFYDNNNMLRTATDVIDVDKRTGLFTLIGIKQAQEQEVSIVDKNFKEARVVFNGEASAILSVKY